VGKLTASPDTTGYFQASKFPVFPIPLLSRVWGFFNLSSQNLEPQCSVPCGVPVFAATRPYSTVSFWPYTSTVRSFGIRQTQPPQNPGRWGKTLVLGVKSRLCLAGRPLPQNRKAGVRKARDISGGLLDASTPSDNLTFFDAIYDFLVHLRRTGRVQGSSSFQGHGTPVPYPNFGRGRGLGQPPLPPQSFF